MKKAKVLEAVTPKKAFVYGEYELVKYYLQMEKERVHYSNSIDKYEKKGIAPPDCLNKVFFVFSDLEKELREKIKVISGSPKYAAIVNYLKGYKGISDWSAVLPLLFIDLDRCGHFSQLIKYCGLAPIATVYGCRECGKDFPNDKKVKLLNKHIVCPHCQKTNSFIKEGKADFYSEKGKAAYNNRMKMIVLGRIATQLSMCKGAFKERYDEYKAASLLRNPDAKKSFHHAKARRKMMRDYLFVVWSKWRMFMGLPIPSLYPGAVPIRFVHPDKADKDIIKNDDSLSEEKQ